MLAGVASTSSWGLLGQELRRLHLCMMGCTLEAAEAQGMKHLPVRTKRACHRRAPALPLVILHGTEINLSRHYVKSGACSLGYLMLAMLHW